MPDWDAIRRAWNAEEDAPPHTRPVPACSGEGAIYTPAYLERKEGNARGTQPRLWLRLYVPDGM